MEKRIRILVAPLDWGIGHAARCVPVIRELLKKNVEVIIGADNHPLSLLQIEFPDLAFLKISGYDISYSSRAENMAVQMLFQIPKILYKIKKENRQLQYLIREHKIDAVISDNRYGLFSPLVPSVFITHQISVQSPFLQQWIHRLNLQFIHRFKECWIPDFEGEENLSGELSHGIPLPKNAKFIGPLSRFATNNNPQTTSGTYEMMAMLSGPEPQRTIFEKIILNQLKKSGRHSVMVRGLPGGGNSIPCPPSPQLGGMRGAGSMNVEIHDHLSSDVLAHKIATSGFVIARAGYSTIMDLAALGKKAVLVPTPGQTEQEYLAEYLSSKKIFFSMRQNEFDLEKAVVASENYSGMKWRNGNAGLNRAVEELIKGTSKNSLVRGVKLRKTGVYS